MNRIKYLDYLRVFACFAVVFFHISGNCGLYMEFSFREGLVMSMYQQLVKWCVPIFVMISGAVFLRPTMNNNICRIYKKNILHILVVFIFWSLVYASYQFMISDEPTIRGWVIHFLRGHFHMWFLLLILGLYILAPILRVLVKDRKITKYYLVVSFIVSFVVPFILNSLEILFPIFRPIVTVIQGWIDCMQLQSLNAYCFYFVLGYYLSADIFKKRLEVFGIFLAIASFLFLELLTCTIGNIEKYDIGSFSTFTSLLILFESVGIFILFKRLFGDRNSKMIVMISRYTLGIYMIHMVVIYGYISLGGSFTIIDPLLSIPIITLAVFLISMGIIAMLCRIPIINKWIV